VSETQKFLTTREAANYLGLAPSTLAKLRVNGGGPKYRKLLAAVRYSTFDLTQWVDERTRTSTSSRTNANS
jgi:predicted DNA-binding transcriptional regulator AlpA